MSSRSQRGTAAPVLHEARRHGNGYQLLTQYPPAESCEWEALSQVRRNHPALADAIDSLVQRLAATAGPGAEGAQAAMAVEAMEEWVSGAAGPAHPAAANAGSAELAALREQLRSQQAELERLRTALPQRAEEPSRFARKEPRAQDLPEYLGGADGKLDEWLVKLRMVQRLFQLSEADAVLFGASRLGSAALQWWDTVGDAARSQIATQAALGEALRARFQPVATERAARDALMTLQQGGGHVNKYIEEFQRLRALVPTMAEPDALYLFQRGLRRDLAEKLLIEGVTKLQDAINMAARVGSVTHQAQARPGAGLHRMEAPVDGVAAELAELRAQLNAIQQHQGGQLQRGGRPSQHGRGGRGGFGSGRGGRQSLSIPGVPDDVIQQRKEAGLCFRCGSDQHRSAYCGNSVNAQVN